MFLNDYLLGVEDFTCLNQDVQDLRIFRMLLNDLWWGVGDFLMMLLNDCFLEVEDFICQNQDVQDLRIYRMLLNDLWWEVGDFICLNQDNQD
jgi:hypothetical protein